MVLLDGDNIFWIRLRFDSGVRTCRFGDDRVHQVVVLGNNAHLAWPKTRGSYLWFLPHFVVRKLLAILAS